MTHLTNASTLVSGATGGIGVAVCQEFAEKGSRIIAVGRNIPALEELISSLPGTGHTFIPYDAQDSIPPSIPQPCPDIVIHAIGGTLGFRSPATARKNWQAVFNANFHAVVEIDRPIIEQMKERGSGRIIHLCSSSAFHCRGSMPYGSAKAALAHYSRAQGKRLARDGVIVFGFSPGPTESPGNWGKAKIENPKAYQEVRENQPLGRFLCPKEIAKNLAFLCREEAAIYAGCLINADGTL